MSLQLIDISLTYPDGNTRLTALNGVNLEATQGRVTAVVGPSGSGKSSLLAIAATLIGPDSGAVVIDGIPVSGMSRARLSALRRDKIGMVFQQPNLLPALTSLEQLEIVAHISGRSTGTRRRRRRATELLDAVGLAQQFHRRPAELSGGQRQRVNIARALVNSPTVLLVDEPTSALDHERGRVIVELIRNLTIERGIATVLVTHDQTLLDEMDPVAVMDDGRLTMRQVAVLGRHARVEERILSSVQP